MKRSLLFSLPIMMLVFISCKKETEEFTSAPISDYAPYTVGKYITYRLDSLVYINFGATAVTRSYTVKYEVDSETTDNTNRPTYKIIRYMMLSPGVWRPDATFEAINTGSSLEFKENNERYIKLRTPIKNGFTWKGNSYIDTYSINSQVRYLDGWDYTYDSVGVATKVGTYDLENTIKVNQRDEVIGFPADPTSYSEINRGVEKYAKGLGLVYRHFIHSEYQPATPGRNAYYQGYGITLTMIDHN